MTMTIGREALDRIKDQVSAIKKMQNEAEMKIREMNRDIAREKAKLKALVKNFPVKERDLYEERINQVTQKFL